MSSSLNGGFASKEPEMGWKSKTGLKQKRRIKRLIKGSISILGEHNSNIKKSIIQLFRKSHENLIANIIVFGEIHG